MNREIKFRAWDKNNKEMFDVTSIDFTTDNMFGVEAPMVNRSKFQVDWVSFKDIELMQYTGLKDTNGVEIYGGDVLLGRFNVDDVEDHIWLRLTNEEKVEQKRFFIVEDIFYLYTHQIPGDLEVIGNIYENPELLDK